jgi:hypothetical protein
VPPSLGRKRPRSGGASSLRDFLIRHPRLRRNIYFAVQHKFLVRFNVRAAAAASGCGIGGFTRWRRVPRTGFALAELAWRLRRGGREAEGGGLLNRYTLSRRIVGSNPIPSAMRSLETRRNPHKKFVSFCSAYTRADTCEADWSGRERISAANNQRSKAPRPLSGTLRYHVHPR